MAETDTAQQNQGAQKDAPMIQVMTQYIKDLSFEHPNAPDSLVGGWPAPETGMQINLKHRQIKDDIHEAVLSLKVEAKNKENGKTAFIVDLSYCAMVQLKNIPEENVRPVLMVEVPKLLFPFAREIVADMVQKGGFPPLYLQPIAFEALYMNEAKRQKEGAQKEAGHA